MADSSAAPVTDMDRMGGKPVCGSGEDAGKYDLPLHVVALFLVLAASILGAGFPIIAKRVKWVKVPAKTFFICKHFGTGVLIATAFVHLLPTAFGNLMDPCLPDLFTDQYPAMPGVIMMGSMFCLFVVEMYINGKMGGEAHSHGGPMGFETHAAPSGVIEVKGDTPFSRPPRHTTAEEFEIQDIEHEKKIAQQAYLEKVRVYQRENPSADDKEMDAPSEMPAWFVVFYEQYVRQRLEMISMIRMSRQPEQSDVSGKRQTVVSIAPAIESPYIDVETGEPVDPQTYRRMSMNIALLEGGILFHSVFVGMTVSITTQGFVVLLVAILFHQMFEGLGLGARIAAVPYKRGSIRPWLLVAAFGMTAPIGQAIGLAVRGSYDPNSAFGLIIVGVFNAISSGLLLYASLVDLLAEDFLSAEAHRTLTKKDRILAFGCVILGAIGMSIVGAFA